jgi:hypothetical protein
MSRRPVFLAAVALALAVYQGQPQRACARVSLLLDQHAPGVKETLEKHGSAVRARLEPAVAQLRAYAEQARASMNVAAGKGEVVKQGAACGISGKVGGAISLFCK